MRNVRFSVAYDGSRFFGWQRQDGFESVQQALEEALTSTDDVEEALKGFSAASDPSPLAEHQQKIDEHFGQSSVEEILASLEADESEWAKKQIQIMGGKSPTSLKIAFRQMREGAKANFEECMKIEWRMVNRIYDGHDFFEGIRAVVVDKDNDPKWKPASLDLVKPSDVDKYFAPLENELPV